MVPGGEDWKPQVLAALRKGAVIPAHPLALTADRKLDTRRQRALARYYLDAGAGGLAVGVHTQFAIREAALFEPVLELAMRSAEQWARESPIMIAGLVGRTAQAVKEAQVARGLGYHAGLLSLAAVEGASEDELIAHAQTVAREIPLVGFTCSPRWAASCCRSRSGGGSRRSRTWSPSRSRRSIVTAPSTWCAASWRRTPPTASRAIPATTITSSSTSSPPAAWRRMAASAPCASRAGCSAIGVCGSSGRSSFWSASTRRSPRTRYPLNSWRSMPR